MTSAFIVVLILSSVLENTLFFGGNGSRISQDVITNGSLRGRQLFQQREQIESSDNSQRDTRNHFHGRYLLEAPEKDKLMSSYDGISNYVNSDKVSPIRHIVLKAK